MVNILGGWWSQDKFPK